ncbi:MAG: hypothetical protein M0R06_18060 [Sphaerochaeta sp.]|nr:hypothetical protein [Sphaerochaeta sp.]
MPDYGLGQTNINHETGIRYGVINQNDILQAWADSSEPDYRPPSCPWCGEEVEDTGYHKQSCPHCGKDFRDYELSGDEPYGFYLDDGEYRAFSDDYGDIFVIDSPYYTRARFCSPCAPGACHLHNPDDMGEKAYCFGPDWFDSFGDDEPTGEFNGQATSCPYPVYRVADDACIYTPKEE